MKQIEVFGYKGKCVSHFYFIHNLNVFSFMVINDLGKNYITRFNFSSITNSELIEEVSDREEDNAKPLFLIDQFEINSDDISFIEFFDRFSGTEITDR